MDAIIFDLDNCLFHTKSLGKHIEETIIESMQSADNLSFLTPQRLTTIREHIWFYSFRDLVAKNSIPEKIAYAAQDAYRNYSVPHALNPYSDIEVLNTIQQPKFLVTSGYYNLQMSKIKALGIEKYFCEIFIDVIDDKDNTSGKVGIFEQISQKYKLSPEKIVVIGDNCDSEIKAGKQLQMITVQILRPGVNKGEIIPDYYVTDLYEFKKWLESMVK